MFDQSYRTRAAFNHQKAATEAIEDTLGGVARQVRDLRSIVHELSVTVQVLSSLLEARGGIDPAEFRDRMERELRPADYLVAERQRQAADAAIHGSLRTDAPANISALETHLAHPAMAKCGMCGAPGRDRRDGEVRRRLLVPVVREQVAQIFACALRRASSSAAIISSF